MSLRRKALLRSVARGAMLRVVRLDHRAPLTRRMRLLKAYGITTVIDVGANSGGYAQDLRTLGYRGRIISFEPLSSAFADLRQNQAKKPHRWEIANLALGDRPGHATINIAANSVSSSILPMLPTHLASAPESGFVGQEQVVIETLDAIIQTRVDPSERVFVKTDTQGYDARVLAGGSSSMKRIIGVQVEMSLVQLYEGEMLIVDMIQYLGESGLTLMSLEPGFANRVTGQLLQADGLFFRVQPAIGEVPAQLD